MHQEDLKSIAQADDTDEDHDPALEPLKTGEVEREDAEDAYRRDHRRREKRADGAEPVGHQRGANQ